MSGGTARRTAAVPSKSAVAFRIADFLVRTETEREALFRQHLAATVNRVSPLLVELAMMEGLSLTQAVAAIRPPADWPWRPIVEHPPEMFRRSSMLHLYGGSMKSTEPGRFNRAFAAPGLVLRGVDHPRGRFAIRPCGAVLGFSAAIGGAVLTSFGTSARLKLPDGLPETLRLGLPGRQLDQLVDHPLFRGAGCKITRVETDFADGLPVVAFRTKLVRLRLGGAEPATGTQLAD